MYDIMYRCQVADGWFDHIRKFPDLTRTPEFNNASDLRTEVYRCILLNLECDTVRDSYCRAVAVILQEMQQASSRDFWEINT